MDARFPAGHGGMSETHPKLSQQRGVSMLYRFRADSAIRSIPMRHILFASISALIATTALITGCAPNSGQGPAATSVAPAVQAIATNASPREVSPPTVPAAATDVPKAAATLQPVPTSTATARAAPAADDARQRIFDAHDTLNRRGPYRVRFASALESTSSATMLVVPPERLHITIVGPDGSRFETKQIGATQYANADGTWTKILDTKDSPIDIFKIDNPAAINDIVNVKALGTQTVNGVSATGYAFQDASDPAQQHSVWIAQDGAIVRLVSTDGADSNTADIEFDASIVIDAPAP
jgi:hypothetical protein